jgi:hypothetical protein
MMIFDIRLANSKDPKAFVAFMKDSYFPAVHMGPTRRGQITWLSLGQGDNVHAGDKNEGHFLLSVGWEGTGHDDLPRLDDDGVKAKFEAFKPEVKWLGVFDDVANWPKAA